MFFFGGRRGFESDDDNPFDLFKKDPELDRFAKQDLIFALWKTTYHPGYIVGESECETDDQEPSNKCKSTKVATVFFYHNDKQKDVDLREIVHNHGNLLMEKVKYFHKGKVHDGTVYGNDSPKYDGDIRTFFVRVSKRKMVTVPLRCVFLTRPQAERMLYCTGKKCKS